MPQPLKILIVGGGIAGLTLAKALERAPVQIEYLLFEARDTLAPQIGASIGLAPNGSRILDQLGVYDDISKLLEPVSSAGLHDVSGRCLTGDRTDLFRLIPKRMAYPVAFLERQSLLELLARHIVRRECLLAGKKVQSVEQDGSGATVLCTDGTSYTGDIVVGADGIHSKTRSEMWRAVERTGQFSVQTESNTLTAEYKCLFGISRPIPGLEPGAYDVTHSHDVSTLVITGQGGKVYWFLFGRMAQVYRAEKIPRFTAKQAEEFARQHRRLPIRPRNSVVLGQLWDAREQTTLTSLEEADFAHWTTGRIVCLGDSAHKMTPNSGSGGMLAIESAAALANALYHLSTTAATAATAATVSSARIDQVEAALAGFERRMHGRASATIKSAAAVTRLQALRGVPERLLTRYVLPYAGDFTVNEACESWVGAGRVDYLPVPPRSLVGNLPFNPQQGIGKQETRWKRVLLALPLLALFAVSRYAPVKLFGASSGPSVADFAVWYAIMLVESARRANEFNGLRFALIWGTLSWQRSTSFVAIYYAVQYIFTPISAFKAADMRTTDISYTKTVLPVVLLAYYAPFAVTWLSAVSSHREAAAYLWQIFPVVAFLSQELLTRYILPPSTIQSDRLHNVGRDIPTIKRTMRVFCAVSAAVWQYRGWSRGFYDVLQDDAVLVIANVVWIGLFTWDLKAAGMIDRGWATLVLYGAGLLVAGGNGTLLGLAWLYREETLASKRHKDALVR